MKKFFRICLPIVLVMAIFVCGVIISKNLFGGENEYINISSLSDEFMNEYFSSYAEMAKLENKENILIVTSMHPIGDTFGATHVVEAPNHQYFLYYDSKSKKESALTKFSDDNTLKVQENMTYELTKDDGDGAGSIMTLGNGNSSFDSWGVEAMGLDYMAEAIENIDAEDVTVAILDTGLDVDLFNRYYNGKLAGTFNVLDPESEEISDNVGHGTHIAGTIAESTPSNVKIIAVQMTDAEYIDDTAIVTAVNYVSYYDKADVMNMSFGGYMMDEALYSAIEAANQKNIVSVAAAGNESTNRPSYPAAFNNTISISAVDSNLTFAGFSNRGESVSFAAPGVDIRSIMGKDVSIAQRNGNNDDDDHEIISGTSMATPHVVSAVADLKSINKSLSTANAIDLLKGNSVDLGVKGRDDRFGDGFIKFDDAIICRDAGVYDCDEFGVFEKDITANIVINDVIVTPYNYGSLTNILATTIKITTTNGREIIKPLGDIDIDEISISGYDPYASGEQVVSVTYEGFEINFSVMNPDNFESGWVYDIDGSDVNIIDYKNHGLDIKTLYLPERIGDVVPNRVRDDHCMFGEYVLADDGFYYCSEPQSFVDAPNYVVVVAPQNITRISNINSLNGFYNVTRFVGLADELTIGSNAFSGLERLTLVEANILFDSYEGLDEYENPTISYGAMAFNGDKSLASITLSENNHVIPEYSFSDCVSLTSINIPDSVTEIGREAFRSSGIKRINGGQNLEKIGDYAFWGASLEEFYAPASLIVLGRGVFLDTQLSSLEVASDNPVFDSRDDSNAIIETATNKLIVGTKTTVIPSSVRIIAKGAFVIQDGSLKSIEIPEGVTTIEEGSIYSPNLRKIVLPMSLESIDWYWNSFPCFGEPGVICAGGYDGIPLGFIGTVYWVHRDSYALEKALEFDVPYVIIEEGSPDEICAIITQPLQILRVFQELNSENYEISVGYCDESTGNYLGEEIISEYQVAYEEGADNLYHTGNVFVEFTFDDAHGHHNLSFYNVVFVDKAIPEYTIPTGITGVPGQLLSEILLPDGFSWMHEDWYFQDYGFGEAIYDARFTPEDTDNYEIVEYIPITIRTIANQYSITFVDEDGTTVLKAATSYDYGTLAADIEKPADPEKASDALHTYVFIGWTPEITDVTENKTYTASYRSIDKTMIVPEFNFERGNIITNDPNPVESNEISVTNMEVGTYEISDVVVNSGSSEAEISFILTISNEAFNNYYLEGGLKSNGYIINVPVKYGSNGYTGPYDGEEHTITFNINTTGCTIRYKVDELGYVNSGMGASPLSEEDYNVEEQPAFKDIGVYVVNYYIICDNRQPVEGASVVKITGIVVDSNILRDGMIRVVRNQVEDLLDNIYAVNDNMDISKKILDENGTELGADDTQTLKTGYSVQCAIQDENHIYNIALVGDVDGDGDRDPDDLFAMRNHLIKKAILKGIYLLAGDITDDGKLNSADLLRMKQHLLGIRSIE